MLHHPLVGIVVALVGIVISSATSLIAQVTTSPDFANLSSAAGTVSAVGALIYVARKFANGDLVARQPAQVEVRLLEIADNQQELLKASHRREEILVDFLRGHSGPAH